MLKWIILLLLSLILIGCTEEKVNNFCENVNLKKGEICFVQRGMGGENNLIQNVTGISVIVIGGGGGGGFNSTHHYENFNVTELNGSNATRCCQVVRNK